MKTLYKLYFFCMLVGTLSCSRFIEIDVPKTELTRRAVFADDQSAFAALEGLYAGMANTSHYIGGTQDGLQYIAGLTADDYGYMRNKTGFVENQIDPASTSITMIWKTAYLSIYQANALIEGVGSGTALSAAVREQIEAEARFIRAFNYFYLINLFGDVPLIITTDYEKNSLVYRTPVTDIYQQIVTDLNWAKEILPRDFSAGKGQRVRVNYWAVNAFLASVYAYTDQWKEAETLAGETIDQPALFHLTTSLDSTFLANNTEAIWQLLPPGASYNAPEGFLNRYNASVYEFVSLTDDLVDAFEPADKRRMGWIAERDNYFYCNKYKAVLTMAPSYTEYSTPLRLAEQYLLRSEARVHLGNLTGSLSDLNQIRRRAGLPDAETNSSESLLAAIEKERRLELFSEYGHRWLDLKRWGRADAVLGNLKPTWASTAVWYPIPEAEILKDPHLTQNSGY
ncbi:RagB/SusD domain-containing protein [bacterium A37T11]|nr:RagB/SusD domain-containing protein [bacterium A37T11]